MSRVLRHGNPERCAIQNQRRKCPKIFPNFARNLTINSRLITRWLPNARRDPNATLVIVRLCPAASAVYSQSATAVVVELVSAPDVGDPALAAHRGGSAGVGDCGFE